jgi:hypothetical protein
MSRFSRVIALSKKPSDFQKAPPPMVVTEPPTTVIAGLATTVVDKPETTIVAIPANTVLWQAGNGALFPSSRVRRIQRAQDALTHAEESVYDFLWGAKTQALDEFRLVRAGYDRISKAARITKRNAALIVDRLAEKGFLQVEHPADTLHRTPTQYRVLGYRSVLDELDRRGHRWVVKSGNGVLFVRQLRFVGTIVADPETTVVVGQPTTVAAATTHRDNKRETERDMSSSEVREVQKTIVPLGLSLDDDGVSQIITASREVNPKASPEEIAHFIGIAVQHNHRGEVRTWVGFLKAAVPKYLVEGSTTLVAYREGKAREKAELRRQAQAVKEDPQATQQEREWAAGMLADSS